MKKASLILLILLILPAVSAQVIINEIMYDFPGSDDNHEWIEIYNAGSETIDLTNWKFYEAETNHKINLTAGNWNLSSDGYAVIAEDATAFPADYPDFSGNLFDSSFSLGNAGETIAIKDANGTIIDEVTYNSSLGANGDGKSLERVNSTSWAPSTDLGGSPGKKNNPFLGGNNYTPNNETQNNTEQNQTENNSEEQAQIEDVEIKIISAPEQICLGENFTADVEITNNFNVSKDFEVYSYVYYGHVLATKEAGQERYRS